MSECVLKLPPLANNQQWGYVLESQRLVGFVAPHLPLATLVPVPGALVNVTLVGGLFDDTDLRAQWSSHCIGHQLFGQAVARVGDPFAKNRWSRWSPTTCITSPRESSRECGWALCLSPQDPSPCF